MPVGRRAPPSTSTSAVDVRPADAKGVGASTVGFSDGLAGRGIDINAAIGAFVPLLRPRAGGAQPRFAERRPRRVPPWARGPRRNPRAGREHPGDPVHKSRQHVPRARERAVPYLQDAISETRGVQRGNRQQPERSAIVTDSAALFSELRPGSRHCRRARRARRRVRRRVRNLPGTAGLDQRLVSLSTRRRTTASPTVQQGLDRPDAARVEPALAARVPDPGPVDVQLRDAVPPQRRKPVLSRLGHVAAILPGRHRRRARRRGGAVEPPVHDAQTNPTRRARAAPRRSVSEHRLARRDRGMRGRQRALSGGSGSVGNRPGTRAATRADARLATTGG